MSMMDDKDSRRFKDSLSAYGPIRYRNDMWWRYSQLAAKDGHVVADGRISGELRPLIEHNLIMPYLSAHAEFAKDHAGYQFGSVIPKMHSLVHWVPLAAQYELCGRQIFDLGDRLVEMFSQTDLGGCTLESLHLPYEAFFVRFGRQQQARLLFEGTEGTPEVQYEYLDGVFVARTPWPAGGYRLKLGFTTVKEDGSGVMLPGNFIDLLPDEMAMPVEDAISASLARRLKESEAGLTPDQQSQAIASHMRQDYEDSAQLLRTGARLLFNALFYLEDQAGVPGTPEPGRDTPSAQVARWFQAKPEKRYKQRSSLTADGYAVVRMVGREVENSTPVAASSGGAVKVHWRRGHWRQQPYGEGQLLRKRVWIKPVMVGAKHHDGSELPGHIYVADKMGVIN